MESEPLLVGERVEAALDEILDVRQPDLGWIHIHLAGFDLRQIEHVVDEIEQIAA